MMRMFAIGLAVAGVVSVLSATAVAAPIRLSRAEFDAQTAGLPTILEDFEGLPSGGLPSPVTFLNGTFFPPTTLVGRNSQWCTAGFCLWEAGSHTSVELFGDFPSGSTFWGLDLHPAGGGTNFYTVVVTGNSGVLQLDNASSDDTFFGFNDSSGLVSLSFVRTSGGFNTSYDNAISAVPEPTTGLLVGLGVAALAALRRGAA